MTPQCKNLLDWLDERGSITPLVALRELGIYRLASRVLDLRRDGYPIETVMVERSTRSGKARVAEYRLN
jgi:hypothetical protein